MSMLAESLLCYTARCAWAAGMWMTTFLENCGKQITSLEVPQVLDILYSSLQAMSQSIHRVHMLQAVHHMARFHQEPVISSLLQEHLLPARHAMELWEMLGSSGLGVQILQHLTQQLEAAGENESVGALGSAELTCAISMVVVRLPAEERIQHLLPHFLPGLLWPSVVRKLCAKDLGSAFEGIARSTKMFFEAIFITCGQQYRKSE